MDYNKLYNHYEIEVNNEMSSYILSQFKDNDDRLNFLNIYNDIVDYFREKKDNLAKTLKALNNDVMFAYNHRIGKYSAKTTKDLLLTVIELEISDIVNTHDDIQVRSEIIESLFKYEFYEYNLSTFSNNDEFFKLIRETKKYDYINFLDTQCKSLKSTPEYKEMLDLRYPGEKNRYNEVTREEPKFTDDEIIVLRGIVYRILKKSLSSGTIPFSANDFNKLMSILGKLENDINLYQNANANDTKYKLFLNGYKNLEINSRKNKIDILIDKIKDFKISPITDALKRAKRE